ncbi:MAG: hypothetical protein V3S82_01005, partial [Dehalococcoidia bacterium]
FTWTLDEKKGLTQNWLGYGSSPLMRSVMKHSLCGKRRKSGSIPVCDTLTEPHFTWKVKATARTFTLKAINSDFPRIVSAILLAGIRIYRGSGRPRIDRPIRASLYERRTRSKCMGIDLTILSLSAMSALSALSALTALTVKYRTI